MGNGNGEKDEKARAEHIWACMDRLAPHPSQVNAPPSFPNTWLILFNETPHRLANQSRRALAPAAAFPRMVQAKRPAPLLS